MASKVKYGSKEWERRLKIRFKKSPIVWKTMIEARNHNRKLDKLAKSSKSSLA